MKKTRSDLIALSFITIFLKSCCKRMVKGKYFGQERPPPEGGEKIQHAKKQGRNSAAETKKN